MKKTSLIIILSCLSFFGFAQYNILDSLILYYPFDGNANDWSGYNFDGTVSGASLTTDHQGNANHAYYFDGVNDFIDLPNNPKLHPDFPFTFGAWVKPENISTNPHFHVVCTEFTTTNTYNGALLQRNSSQALGAIVGNGGIIGSSSSKGKYSNQTLQDNNWYYVVGVYESVSNIKVYINCVEDAGIYIGSATTYYKNTSLRGSIGRFHTGSDYSKGIIDEVAIWNRALDPDEIPQLCETDIWQIMQMKVEAEENQSFSIFPNPMSTKAEIYFPNPNKEMHTIKIYSISGQEILSLENINTEVFSIEKENLANGMYIVELYNTITNRSIFEKLIIQ